MSKSNKKQLREAAVKAEKAKREDARLSQSPLDKDQMLSLYTFVGSCIVENGHDHDFTNTDRWLLENGFELSSAHDFFLTLKIGDDWDLLTNGDPFSLFGSSSTHHAWMPLEKEELESLINFLEDELAKSGCDHKLRITESWLSNTKYDPNLIKAALLAQGGGCDCEVMYNVESDGNYV